MRSFTLIYIEQLRGAVKQQNLRRKKKITAKHHGFTLLWQQSCDKKEKKRSA